MNKEAMIVVFTIQIIILSIFPITWSIEAECKDGSFGGGNGTLDNPYVIEDVWDLQAMNDDLSAHYILKNDINASVTKTWNYGGGFSPIGHYSAEFNGSLDGRGYNITGLVINWPNVLNIGLIGYSGTESKIKNLNLVEITLNSGDDIGGLIGYNRGKVIDSNVSGKVTGKPSYHGNIGGIVGTNEGSISRSNYCGNVTWVGEIGLTKGKVGGIVGNNIGFVDNCTFYGNVFGGWIVGGAIGINYGSILNIKVDGNIEGYEQVGGIVGSSSALVSRSCFSGNISGWSHIGGIGGFVSGGTVTNCYAWANTTGWKFVGGLLGSNSGSVINSQADGRVNGPQSVGGLIGQNNEGSLSNCNASVITIGEEIVGGLAGENNGGTIVNCRSNGITIGTSSEESYVGGLVGYNNGSIFNSRADGTVEGIDSVGGFVGINKEGSISNCTSYVVTIGEDFVGGLAGENLRGTVVNCQSHGDTIGTGFQFGVIGGLVGRNTGPIYDSIATGKVTGVVNWTWSVGGLVGANSELGTITSSFAAGDVLGSGGVGGLVGSNNGMVSNSSSFGNVNGTSMVGGLVGNNNEGQGGSINSSFSLGNVSGHAWVGGLVGHKGYGFSISNSHYNVEKVLINGAHHVTFGGLFDPQYRDWIENEMNLEITDYGSTLRLADDHYEISGVQGFMDLLGFADIYEYKYRLVMDLDFSQYSNIYIPYLASQEFDGNGKTIFNLCIDQSFSSGVGLFGTIIHGSINNLYLENVQNSGYWWVGGLIGQNYYGNIIASSIGSGNVSGINDVGGLIGNNYFGSLSSSFSKACVNGIENIGGLVGFNWGSISKSYSTGRTEGDSKTGGLIGTNFGGSVFDSYSTGLIIGTGQKGGLIGNSTKVTVSNCFWDVQTSGLMTSGGGVGKTTKEMKTKSIYTDAGWDFGTVWTIIENGTYPFLRWQDRLPPVADPGLNITVDEGTIVTLNGEKSLDDMGIINYTWTFTDGDKVMLHGLSTLYRFNNPGLFIVNLTVEDSIGNLDTDSMTVKVNDSVPPVAKLSFKNSDDFYRIKAKKFIVRVNENITLSAEGSFDPVGEIVEYHWEIPSQITLISGSLSGDKEASERIIFRFDGNSNYYHNITLWVRDSSGLVSPKDWVSLMPDSAPPYLDSYTIYDKRSKTFLVAPYMIDEDVELEFNASRASDNGEVIDHIWSFNDGSGPFNGMIVDHYFFDPGSYNISLLLVDAVGNRMKFENRTILVRDTTKPIPVMVLSDLEIDMGSEVVLDGSRSYDPRTTGDLYDAISSYTWYLYSVGENYTKQTVIGHGGVIEHTFLLPGYWVLNLTIIDENGLTAWTEKTLLIGGPDLQVDAVIFVDPAMDKIKEGDRAKISIIIKNTGTTDIQRDIEWDLKVTLDGKTIQIYTIDREIRAGGSIHINFSYTFESRGSKELMVYLDPTNVVPEMVENNNDYEIDFKVNILNDGGFPIFCISQLVLTILLIGLSLSLFLYLRKRMEHGTSSGGLQEGTDQASKNDDEVLGPNDILMGSDDRMVRDDREGEIGPGINGPTYEMDDDIIPQE